MSCLLKDFLKQFALEPGEMLQKLLDSQAQDRQASHAVKLQFNSLQAGSFDLNTCFLFWGMLAQNTEQARVQDVLYHALLLDATHLNDPYSQASYAAIELYKCLKHEAHIQVYLQNLEHQVIMIHAQDARYIYDPIKDPQLLFTVEEYQAKAVYTTLLINQPLLLAYEALREKFHKYLEQHTPVSHIKQKKRHS